MRAQWFLAGCILSSVVVACGENTASVAVTECASGTKWVGGDEGNEEMHPGQDCIACHASRGEGPHFTIAGTVYGPGAAADDCFGTTGVTVRITGSDGKTQDLTPNGAGNFFSRSAIAMPYTASIVRNGQVVSQMTSPQQTGACNSCHTASSSQGRVLAP